MAKSKTIGQIKTYQLRYTIQDYIKKILIPYQGFVKSIPINQTKISLDNYINNDIGRADKHDKIELCLYINNINDFIKYLNECKNNKLISNYEVNKSDKVINILFNILGVRNTLINIKNIIVNNKESQEFIQYVSLLSKEEYNIFNIKLKYMKIQDIIDFCYDYIEQDIIFDVFRYKYYFQLKDNGLVLIKENLIDNNNNDYNIICNIKDISYIDKLKDKLKEILNIK